MNITVRNEYRVEVELSPEELSGFGITYDEFDYGSIETRRVLWTLLDEVKKASGIEIKLSGKLLIEVIKESGDFCCICFTSLPPRGSDEKSLKQLVKSETVPIIVEFANIDDAYLAARESRFSSSASLYEKNGRYRLVFTSGFPEKNSLSERFSEFGEIIAAPVIENARCAEMWRCISKGNAAEALSRVYRDF